MKDRTIKDEHFDYANTLVQYLGFKNLSDFTTIVPYSIAKNESKTICDNFTKSLEIFKKLFPLDKFDLRKINYKFENIDQVIGFVKKIFEYLGL